MFQDSYIISKSCMWPALNKWPVTTTAVITVLDSSKGG